MQTEAKVGFAVILAAIMLVTMLGKVERWTSSTESGTRILTRFNTVAGLEVKSAVQVAGVTVGQVESINLENGMADVEVLLFPGVNIYRGAKATIRSTGLLGDKYMEILSGDPNLGLLTEGEMIPQLAGGGDLDQLISEFGLIAADIRAVSGALRNAVGTAEGEAQLKTILGSVSSFTTALSDEGPSILKRLNLILTRVEEGTGTIGKLVNDPSAYESLQTALAQLKDVVAKVNRGEGTLGKLVQDPELYERLEGAASGVEEFTRQATHGDGTIGRLMSDDGTVENLNAAMESFSKMGSRIQKTRLDLGFRNEFQLSTDENKGYFWLELTPQTRRSYVVALVDDPQGKVRWSRTVISGTTPSTAEELRTDRKLLVSALIKQRFGKAEVHGGLMEGRAGIGAGYTPVETVSLLVDAWDFDSVRANHDEAHLKVTARLAMGDYIFLQGGMDNFLNSSFDTPFVGAGLSFEDDDLKYLLGSVAAALN